MLQAINKTIEKWMPLVTPTSVLIGILFASIFSPYTAWVPLLFGFMTFAGSMGMNFKDLKRVLTQPMPIFVILAVLHIFMPLVAWGVGSIIFPDDPLTVTGLILLLVIPTGVVSFMWVSMYKGDGALTLSLILIDTLLSPFLVPLSMSIAVGTDVKMDTLGMMKGLLEMVVIPSILGICLNQWTRGRAKASWSPRLAPFSKVCLALVIMINSSVIAPYLKGINWKFVEIAIVCIVIVAFGYVFGYVLSKWLKWDRDLTVTMTFNCGMRNISSGAVLAIKYFPPPVAIPVIIGMIFQQMMASLFAQLFFGRKKDGIQQKGGKTGAVRRTA